MEKKISIWSLFFTFFKIGAFTIGGGLAMISVIEKELVERKKWITNEDLLNMIAIAESTPGVIAVNSATYVGYKLLGFWGSFFSTLGVVLPSLIMISLITFVYQWFLGFEIVKYAFKGASAAVAVLILNAGIKLLKQVGKSAYIYLMMGLTIILSLIFMIFNISTIYIIIIGFVIGICYYATIDKMTKDGEKSGNSNSSC